LPFLLLGGWSVSNGVWGSQPTLSTMTLIPRQRFIERLQKFAK
jgi:hypothetical protein